MHIKECLVKKTPHFLHQHNEKQKSMETDSLCAFVIGFTSQCLLFVLKH